MANKNITMRILDDDGAYNKLYPQTSATQSEVSTDTQQLFGQDNVDACLDKLADAIGMLGRVAVKIVDVDGNPIQGATITGFGSNVVVTNASGQAGGILTTNPIRITSPYADMKDATADVKDSVGSIDPVVITLPSVAENEVVRYLQSRSVKFSSRVSNIDVCCVGAGGGGGASITRNFPTSTGYIVEAASGGGGGGGDVKNLLAVSITENTNYPIVIGAGGVGGTYNNYFYGSKTTGDGGTTSFGNLLSAGGGYGGNGADVGFFYSDRDFGNSTMVRAATQGGLGGGSGYEIVNAYMISGKNIFASDWLTATKGSTSPINPQVGILYRLKTAIDPGNYDYSRNGFYVWNGSQYALADMTAIPSVGGNGGNGYAYDLHSGLDIQYNPTDGIASSSAAVEFDSTTKQAGGGAGGSRTTTALTPGAPNGGAGGIATNYGSTGLSVGSAGGYGGGGGGAGYIFVPTSGSINAGEDGGAGGSGMVAIRFHF